MRLTNDPSGLLLHCEIAVLHRLVAQELLCVLNMEAYGIENESVVLVDSLQSENLDMNEFQAAIDSLSLAVHNHHDVLAQYHEHVDAAQG